MSDSWYFCPNRYLCSVLREMRDAIKVDPDSIFRRHLLSLIEEAQTYANRMETALDDWSDVRSAREMISELKEEHKALKRDIKRLENKKKQLKESED